MMHRFPTNVLHHATTTKHNASMSLIKTVASVAKINSVWCPINQARQMSTIPDDASLPNKRPPPPWSRKIPVVSNSARKERTPQHTMHSFTHFLRLKTFVRHPACSTRFTHHGRQRIYATAKRTHPWYTKFKILQRIQIPRLMWRSAETVNCSEKCVCCTL